MKLKISILNYAKKKIVPVVFKISKSLRRKIDRIKLVNGNFTIFACNCSAGCMYHDLGLRFDSPTINLYIYPEHYIQLLKDPIYYFNKNIKFLSKENKKEPFPVGTIGDGERKITIFFNHYNSEEDALNKWNDRVTRIHCEYFTLKIE